MRCLFEEDALPTVYLRSFPEDLHHRSKIRAAVDRITLKDLVVSALEKYMAGEETESVREQIAVPIPNQSVRQELTSARDAWAIAGNSISELERIARDDPKREEALLRVKAWIENELNWKAVRQK